jgi:hypothetical protein
MGHVFRKKGATFGIRCGSVRDGSTTLHIAFTFITCYVCQGTVIMLVISLFLAILPEYHVLY